MTDEEVRERILDCIINCEMSLVFAPYAPAFAVVPISNILYLIDGLTRYKARKALKQLKKEGLIEYASQGQPAIFSQSAESYPELIDEARPPINGYSLTKKGRNTETYKKKLKELENDMEKFFEEL